MTTSKLPELEPAYVLHARKYRDTSLILELFTQRHGRVAAVQRGARSKKSSSTVQPFTPILISYTGSGDLKTLSKIDLGTMQILAGDRLLLGMYANELIVRLMGKNEPASMLWHAYQTLLVSLVANDDYQINLRKFELCLLEELGYGISFAFEAASGDMIESEQHYRFVADEGFHPLAAPTRHSFLGTHLLSIADGDFACEATEAAARKIARTAIRRLLGDRPLNSRELFQQLVNGRRE